MTVVLSKFYINKDKKIEIYIGSLDRSIDNKLYSSYEEALKEYTYSYKYPVRRDSLDIIYNKYNAYSGIDFEFSIEDNLCTMNIIHNDTVVVTLKAPVATEDDLWTVYTTAYDAYVNLYRKDTNDETN